MEYGIYSKNTAPFFLVPFSSRNKFLVITFDKITSSHNLGYHFGKITL